MRLVYASRAGESWDITPVVRDITWSGDRQQVARKAEISLIWSDTSPDYPRSVIAGIDKGERFDLYGDDNSLLFRGYIFSVSKRADASGGERSYTAFDGLIYLLKSSVSHNFSGTTASGVTRQVCAELGLPVGYMPSDASVALSFAHIAKPARDAIMGAWKHVSKATGIKYMMAIEDGALTIREIGGDVALRTLRGDSDLSDAEVSSSIENAITRVLVVDKSGRTVSSADDAQGLHDWGMLQASVQQEEGLDAQAQAKDLLVGAEDQITLTDIVGGSDAYDLITGNAVFVHEPQTGLYGRFYIINDTHSFSDGQHRVSLGLCYEAMMDEAEVELIVAQAAKKKIGRKTDIKPTNSWEAWEKYGDIQTRTKTDPGSSRSVNVEMIN